MLNTKKKGERNNTKGEEREVYLFYTRLTFETTMGRMKG